MRSIAVILCILCTFLGRLHGKDIDVLIYSADLADVRVELDDTAVYLENMLQSTPGFAASSCSQYSQSSVDSLVEGVQDPSFRADTLAQVTGDYDYVVLAPSYWFIKLYPEMSFEGVYHLSKEILAAGAEPLLLMTDAKFSADVVNLGANIYRVANGCGIHANPAGYAFDSNGLIAPEEEVDKQRQAYLIAASLYTQITGLNARELDYQAVVGAADLAESAYTTVQTHQGLLHYLGDRHLDGIIKHRHLDLNAAPFNGTARYCYKGTSTENGLSSHMSAILQANGYTVEATRISSTTGNTKEWVDGDFDLAKSYFDARDDQAIFSYARGTQSSAQQMIDYDQQYLQPMTFDRHRDDIGTGLASTRNMLGDLHQLSYAMFVDHFQNQWNTVPYHVAAARLYQADPTVVACTDGVHATTAFYNLLASMMLSSTLGQDLQPSTAIQNNAQSLLAFNIGKEMVRQLAYLSEDEVTIPDTGLTIQSSKLAPATRGHSYSYQLLADGGAAPYTWGLLNPESLPDGMNLSSSGLLSGSATTGGNTTMFVFKVRDANGAIRKRALNLLVQDAENPSFAIWAAFQFDDTGLTGGDLTESADPDADGLSNFLEFALNRDPSEYQAEGVFDLSQFREGTLGFSLGQAHLRYRIQSSEDLVDWDTVVWDSESQGAKLVELGGTQYAELPTTDQNLGFYRLWVD